MPHQRFPKFGNLLLTDIYVNSKNGTNIYFAILRQRVNFPLIPKIKESNFEIRPQNSIKLLLNVTLLLIYLIFKNIKNMHY